MSRDAVEHVPGRMHVEAQKEHGRQVRAQIVLPAAAGAAVLLLAVFVTAVLATRSQRSVMADFLVTLLILCPLALCTFPVMLALIVAALSMSRLHNSAGNTLGRVSALVERTNDRIDRVMDRLGRAGVNFGVNTAMAERLIGNVFERQRLTDGREESHESASTRPPS